MWARRSSPAGLRGAMVLTAFHTWGRREVDRGVTVINAGRTTHEDHNITRVDDPESSSRMRGTDGSRGVEPNRPNRP